MMMSGCGGGLGRVRIASPAWRSSCWENSPVLYSQESTTAVGALPSRENYKESP